MRADRRARPTVLRLSRQEKRDGRGRNGLCLSESGDRGIGLGDGEAGAACGPLSDFCSSAARLLSRSRQRGGRRDARRTNAERRTQMDHAVAGSARLLSVQLFVTRLIASVRHWDILSYSEAQMLYCKRRSISVGFCCSPMIWK